MVGFIFSNFLPAGGWRQASFECTWVEQDMGGIEILPFYLRGI